MSEYPEALRCNLIADVPDGLAVCRLVLAETSHPPWPAITTWEIDRDTGSGTLLAALETPAARQAERFDWRCGAALKVSVVPYNDRADVILYLYDVQRERCTDWVVALENLIERLLRRNLPILHGIVERHGGGVADCIPGLTVIGGPSYLVVTDDDVLATVFAHPDNAIAAGGWDERRFGEHLVLTRAFGRETSVEMLSAIQEGQWAMARLARPGIVAFDICAPQPEEEALLYDGERRVLAVGYDKAARAAIFSCATSPDEHIHGWEIYALKDMIEAGKLPDGTRFKELRVVFADEACMHREKRPLLEIGVAVSYHDRKGKLVRFTEAE